MATSAEFMEYVAEQLAEAGKITYRKMFGEYALYLDGKVVGLVCDNQVFIKITEPGKALLGEDAPTGFAYPGAKPSFVADSLDNQDLWVEVIQQTAKVLPAPKPKKK